MLAASPCLQRIHSWPRTASRPLDRVSAGVPDTGSVQEVIFWQGRTIEMMYHIVGKAMSDAGVSNDVQPTDYLQFFCLGGSKDTVHHILAALSLCDADLSCILPFEVRQGAVQLVSCWAGLCLPMHDALAGPRDCHCFWWSLGLMRLGWRSRRLVMCPSLVVNASVGSLVWACAAHVGSVGEAGFRSSDSFCLSVAHAGLDGMQDLEARHRSGSMFCLSCREPGDAA